MEKFTIAKKKQEKTRNNSKKCCVSIYSCKFVYLNCFQAWKMLILNVTKMLIKGNFYIFFEFVFFTVVIQNLIFLQALEILLYNKSSLNIFINGAKTRKYSYFGFYLIEFMLDVTTSLKIIKLYVPCTKYESCAFSCK